MQNNLHNLNMLKINSFESISSENLKRKRAMNEFYSDSEPFGAPPSKNFKRSYGRLPQIETLAPFDPHSQHNPFPQTVETICQVSDHQPIFNHPNDHHIEYVMFDGNLMPVQNPIIATAEHSENLTELTAEWTTNDLLDLDQKTTYTINETGHLIRDNPQEERNNFEAQIVHLEYEKPEPQNTAINKFTRSDSVAPKRGTFKPDKNQQEDLEDKNLSWLFNFKLDELPHLSPEVSNRSSTTATPNSSNGTTSKKLNDIIQEAIVEDENNEIPENAVFENVNRVQKKPPFTYTELIEYALEERKELTVSGIYQWISDRFPYYKSNDDRWKNSVRHNLSINPHFRKGSKAAQGAGHLWTISSRDSEANNLAWEHKKQRLELFFKMEAANMIYASTSSAMKEKPDSDPQYDETVMATASILPHGQYQIVEDNRLHRSSPPRHDTQLISSHYFSQTEQVTYETDSDLRRVAGEILNGVRRNVEVQILQNTNSFHGTIVNSGDYLNPVSKDEIVQESGLQGKNEIGNDFFVTEIDPIELGINMTTNGEDEVLFGDDFNLNYFGLGVA